MTQATTRCWRFPPWSCAGASAPRRFRRSSCWRPHRPHRGGQPGRQCRRRDRLRARARRGQGGGGRGIAGRAARAPARPADRHQGPARDRGPAHHLRLAAASRLRAEGRRRHGGAGAQGRRGDRRQDQRSGVRGRRQYAQSRVGRHRQSVQCRSECRRLVGRLGRGACLRHAARSARARTPGARCAFRPRCAAWSASGHRRAWCRWTCAVSAGRRSRCSAPWGGRWPTCACCSQPRSAWTIASRSPSRCARKRSPARAPSTWAGYAWPGPRTSGNAPSAGRSARSCAPASAPCATCSGRARRCASTSARPTGASISCARRISWCATRPPTTRTPRSLGPNVRANYEAGATMSLKDAAWAHAEQTRIFRRFQANFRDYDWCCRRPRRCRRSRGRSSIWPSSRVASSTTTITGWRSPTTSRSSPIPRSRSPAASMARGCRSGCR